MGGLSNDGPASHLVKIWRQKSGPNDGPVVDQARGMALHANPCNTQGGAGADPSQGRTDCGWRVRKVFPASRGQSVQALRALPDYGAQAVSPTQGGQGQNGTGAMTVWCARPHMSCRAILAIRN